MKWYFKVMRNYAVFSGRARRTEYWMFILINMIILFVLAFLEGLLFGTNVLVVVYDLGVLIPSLAVGVRRMHDTDHSGWWLLVPIVNLIFALTDGTEGDNRFGPEPRIEI